MEELNKVPETGVEETGVAIPAETEIETQAEPVTETVETEVVEETKSEPVESRVEKAFAKRLNASREKIKAELATEYEAKYGRYQKIAEIGAKENGLTLDEYAEYLIEQHEEAPEEQKLDPKYAEVLEEIVKEKGEQKEKEESVAELKAYMAGQAKMLMSYANITDISQIPDEVLEKAMANDTPIVLEFMAWDKANAVKNAEKETIRKIAEQESSGSLSSGGGVPNGIDIFNIKATDPKFDEYVEQALRGKLTSF